MSFFKIALAAVCMVCSTVSFAADKSAEVKNALNAFFKRDVVNSVAPMPVGGLYEAVIADGKIIYTDADVSYISIGGDIIATGERRNLTDETRARLAKIDFSILPLAQAIKRVKGDGSRVLAIFEDPNCPYCKKIHAELDAIDNVTIYTFITAVLGEDSVAKAKKIWCSADRGDAWEKWMVKGVAPESAPCNDVIEANQKLGGTIRLSGTPTIILQDGSRITGFVTSDKIEAGMSIVASAKK